MEDYPHNTLPSIDEEFCGVLERRICDLFSACGDPELCGFWCDGVSFVSDEAHSNFREHVLETREFHTQAWIGADGQDEYRLRIVLSEESIRRISQDESIVDCIPSPDDASKLESNLNSKIMTIELD